VPPEQRVPCEIEQVGVNHNHVHIRVCQQWTEVVLWIQTKAKPRGADYVDVVGRGSECPSNVRTEGAVLPNVTIEDVRDTIEELRVDQLFKFALGKRLQSLDETLCVLGDHHPNQSLLGSRPQLATWRFATVVPPGAWRSSA